MTVYDQRLIQCGRQNAHGYLDLAISSNLIDTLALFWYLHLGFYEESSYL